jgi:hypothetical protein
MSIAGAEARVDLNGFSGTTEVVPLLQCPRAKFLASLEVGPLMRSSRFPEGMTERNARATKSFATLRMTKLCGDDGKKSKNKASARATTQFFFSKFQVNFSKSQVNL